MKVAFSISNLAASDSLPGIWRGASASDAIEIMVCLIASHGDIARLTITSMANVSVVASAATYEAPITGRRKSQRVGHCKHSQKQINDPWSTDARPFALRRASSWASRHSSHRGDALMPLESSRARACDDGRGRSAPVRPPHQSIYVHALWSCRAQQPGRWRRRLTPSWKPTRRATPSTEHGRRQSRRSATSHSGLFRPGRSIFPAGDYPTAVSRRGLAGIARQPV